VAVLSRGYKRKTKGYIVLNDSHSSEEVGDEPLQFYKKFSTVRVAVDANRANGIQQLLKANEATDVILLDDAYQHRKVKAGFYVLLTKYNDLYSDDFLLPTGNLRESRSGAKRANVIIVTKCPINLSLQEKNKIQNRLKVESNQQVFFSTISYSDVIKGKEELAISTL
ncbi:MAG: tetraacyldisaccharide 4'-kinase, partial [Tenacibaculum sp.]